MSTSREFYKFLKEEYKKGDIIYSTGRNAALRIFNFNNNIIDFNDVIEESSDFDNRFQSLAPDTNIHIYLYDYPYIHDEYIKIKNIIETQCDVIKTVND